jgi:hypothetical protein
MTMGVVGVANVSSVFAATTVTEVWPNNASGTTLNTLATTGLTAGASSINMESLTFDDGTVFTKDASTGDACTTFGMKAVKRVKVVSGSSCTFTPTVTGEAKVYLYANTSTINTTHYVSVTNNDNYTPVGKSANSATVLKFDVDADTEYTLTSNGTEMHYIAISVVGTKATYKNTITGDFSAPSDANISSFDVTYGGKTYTATVANDKYTVVIDKKVENGATLTPSVDGYTSENITVSNVTATGDSTDSDVVNTATGSAVAFSKLSLYTVAGTYTPATATLTATDGTLSAENGNFTLTFTQGDTATVKAVATGYYTQSFSYDESNDSASIVMDEMKGVDDTTNPTQFSIKGINVPDYAKSTEKEALTGTFESNGYKLSTVGSNLLISTNRIQMAVVKEDDPTVYSELTYTPESNGTLEIQIAAAGTSGTRGFSLSSTDDDVEFTVGETTYTGAYQYPQSTSDSSKINTAVVTATANVTKGVTYTLKPTGTGMSNLTSVNFTATASDDEIVPASANKVAYVKVGDKVYAIAIIPESQVNDDKVNSFYVSDGTDTNKSDELKTVYSTIQIDGKEYTAKELSSTGAGYLYGFEATNGGDNAKAIIANAVVNYNTTTDVTE